MSMVAQHHRDGTSPMVWAFWHALCSCFDMRHLFLAFLLWMTAVDHPHADTPECEQLAEAAGRSYGIPTGVMGAIARVESGHTIGGRFRAWPWTLNQGGRGSFHPDAPSALMALNAVLENGERNVDIGCMQINWHWHAARFDTASDMLDPIKNTTYAARYLFDLYKSLGDWNLAVMHYHSRDPERGALYAKKVDRELKRADANAMERLAHLPGSEPVPAHNKQVGLLTQPQGALIVLSARAGAIMD